MEKTADPFTWPLSPIKYDVGGDPARQPALEGAACVSLADATAATLTPLLPRLSAATEVALAGTVPADLVQTLGRLPNLNCLWVYQVPREPGALDAILALTHLETLFISGIGRPETIARFAALKNLKNLFFDAGGLDDASFRVLATMPSLQRLVIKLMVQAKQATPLSAASFEAAASSRLSTLYLERVALEPTALDGLSGAAELTHLGLVDIAGVAAISVQDLPRMATFTCRYNPSGATSFRVARVPQLTNLTLASMAAEELTVESAPALRTLTVPGFTRPLRLRVKDSGITAIVGRSSHVAGLELSGVPQLLRVDIPDKPSLIPIPEQQALRTAFPRVVFDFAEREFAKRKPVGPKRKLKKGEQRHRRFGFENMAYGLLVAGKSYGNGVERRVVEQLQTAAEYWAQKLGIHLTAFATTDLTSESGSTEAGDIVDGSVVAGVVVAAVSADDGPSAAIGVEALRAAGEAASALPDDFWKELAGLVGNSAFEELPVELHLAAAGPLATTQLAFGRVVATGGSIRGTDFSQKRHERGVDGAVVAVAQSVASVVDVSESAHDDRLKQVGSGAGYHLVPSYD